MADPINKVYSFIRTLSIHQSQQGDFLALRAQLARHFIGGDASKTLPDQNIRTVRLNGPDCLNVISRHFLYTRVRLRFPVGAARPQSVEGIIRADMAGEL